MKRSHSPLAVELGPGLLGQIFDGIQRPLKTIAEESGDCFIPRGVTVSSLDKSILWEYEPQALKVGDLATGGDIYGLVHENSLMDHRLMLPPGAKGRISYIAPAGQYSIEDKVRHRFTLLPFRPFPARLAITHHTTMAGWHPSHRIVSAQVMKIAGKSYLKCTSPVSRVHLTQSRGCLAATRCPCSMKLPVSHEDGNLGEAGHTVSGGWQSDPL